MDEFDLTTETWTVGGTGGEAFPGVGGKARFSTYTKVIDNKMYMLGGLQPGAGGLVQGFVVYDPEDDTFEGPLTAETRDIAGYGTCDIPLKVLVPKTP